MSSLDEAQSRAPTTVIRDFLSRSISVSDVVRQVWSGRSIVVSAAALGLLYGIYQAHGAGPQFVAAVSVMPAQTDTSSSGAVGMLASLTGSESTSEVPKFTQFLATIGSVGVAEMLNRKYDMVCVVYRGNCDLKTHKWREGTGISAAFKGLLARIGGLPDPNGALTTVDLAQYNTNAIVVTRGKTSALVTLSYNNRDPKFAADYLSKVLHTTSEYIRDQDRAVQRTFVAYVTQRIATNTNIAQRGALDSLLLQQEQKLMLTEVDVPYAATILDGPTVTPVNAVLRIILLNGFMGFLIGVGIALFRDAVSAQFRFWGRIWPRF